MNNVFESLLNYNGLTLLKKQAMILFVKSLSNKDINHLNEIFNELGKFG